MPADAFPGGLRYPDSSRRRRNELLNVAWGALRKRRMLWVMETTGLRRRSRECKKADASALRREQSLAHPPSRPLEHGEESGANSDKKKNQSVPDLPPRTESHRSTMAVCLMKLIDCVFLDRAAIAAFEGAVLEVRTAPRLSHEQARADEEAGAGGVAAHPCAVQGVGGAQRGVEVSASLRAAAPQAGPALRAHTSGKTGRAQPLPCRAGAAEADNIAGLYAQKRSHGHCKYGLGARTPRGARRRCSAVLCVSLRCPHPFAEPPALALPPCMASHARGVSCLGGCLGVAVHLPQALRYRQVPSSWAAINRPDTFPHLLERIEVHATCLHTMETERCIARAHLLLLILSACNAVRVPPPCHAIVSGVWRPSLNGIAQLLASFRAPHPRAPAPPRAALSLGSLGSCRLLASAPQGKIWDSVRSKCLSLHAHLDLLSDVTVLARARRSLLSSLFSPLSSLLSPLSSLLSPLSSLFSLLSSLFSPLSSLLSPLFYPLALLLFPTYI